MELIAFLITGIALYFVSDRLLDWLERRRGARFENRSLIFFAIILGLALIAFNVIPRLFGH
jgi:predicted PurR-regulated permease PerM